MTHPLDADTALEPLTPTRWRGTVSDRWWIVRGPFGGYVATFLTRAMMAAVDDPARRPRSLTVHFVEPPQAGPVEVCATVERSGRSATTLNLRLEQDGRPVALALGSCAAWRDGEPEWAETPPDARKPDAYGASGARIRRPGFVDRLRGPPRAPGLQRQAAQPRVAAVRSPAAARSPRAHGALRRLDAGRLLEARPSRRRADARPDDPLQGAGREREWVLADYRSRFSAGGAWEEDGELWAADGTLLAQSRQLALIRA